MAAASAVLADGAARRTSWVRAGRAGVAPIPTLVSTEIVAWLTAAGRKSRDGIEGPERESREHGKTRLEDASQEPPAIDGSSKALDRPSNPSVDLRDIGVFVHFLPRSWLLGMHHRSWMTNPGLVHEVVDVVDRIDQAFGSKDAVRIHDIDEWADTNLVLVRGCTCADS